MEADLLKLDDLIESTRVAAEQCHLQCDDALLEDAEDESIESLLHAIAAKQNERNDLAEEILKTETLLSELNSDSVVESKCSGEVNSEISEVRESNLDGLCERLLNGEKVEVVIQEAEGTQLIRPGKATVSLENADNFNGMVVPPKI